MSIFTLPTTVPADTILGDGYALDWLGPLPDQDAIEVVFYTPLDGPLASGYGATPADAMCGLLSAFPDSDEVRLPACIAAALDELAHQAVRIVCQRLSGGKLDEATFAEPVGLYDFADEKPACPMCGHGVSHQVIRGPLACDNCGWYRLELTNTTPEGNHPRSKENVLR